MQHALLRTGITVFTAITLAPLAAQRQQATLHIDEHTAVLDYGVPRWGKHSLDALPAGKTWRLGSNEASTLTTDVPLFTGRGMVAPGAYRCRLYRHKDGQRYYLQLDYGRWAQGLKAHAERLPASLVEGEPAERLAIEWQDRAAGAPSPEGGGDAAARTAAPANMHAVDLIANFGPHQMRVEFTAAPGTAVGRLRGYTLTAFQIPSDRIEARNERELPTVVATLRPRKPVRSRKQPPFFNLLISGDTLSLEPALRAPTDSFGFASLEPWPDEWRARAEGEWQAADAEYAHFTITGVEQKRRTLTLHCALGRRTATLQVEIPRPR